MRFARLVITLIGFSAMSVQANAAGVYTNAQAAHGAAVYTQHCAVCHGGESSGRSRNSPDGTDVLARLWLRNGSAAL